MWTAFGFPNWAAAVDGGLHFALVEADELHFGFSHFPRNTFTHTGTYPPGGRRSRGGHRRHPPRARADRPSIVAADGFNLPWHIAHGRRHVPHWFVIAHREGDLAVIDPFTCRSDLGLQRAWFESLDTVELTRLAAAVPLDDRVVALREAFAFGSDAPLTSAAFRWVVHEVAEPAVVEGFNGPAAVRRLAEHFRVHALRPEAYRQADDLWSIARHRAFFARHAAADDELEQWAEAHLAPLARRWNHVAPLIMQATLALKGGRTPTASLPDALDELAEREERAAAALRVRLVDP